MLQSEGFGGGGDDRTKLNEFKDQIKESYASAPKEFLEEVSGIAHAQYPAITLPSHSLASLLTGEEAGHV